MPRPLPQNKYQLATIRGFHSEYLHQYFSLEAKVWCLLRIVACHSTVN